MSGWAEWLAAHGEADPATVADVERVLEAAALRTGDTVLDVGAGLGLLTLAAHERIGEGWVIAVDPSVGALEELLALAHTANASGIMYLVGDAEVLPLPDASVDVAVLGSALLLVADRTAAVRELARVVRPGGRLSLREPVRGDGGDPATAVDWSPLGALGVRAGALAAELASADPPLLDAGWLEQELDASGSPTPSRHRRGATRLLCPGATPSPRPRWTPSSRTCGGSRPRPRWARRPSSSSARAAPEEVGLPPRTRHGRATEPSVP